MDRNSVALALLPSIIQAHGASAALTATSGQRQEAIDTAFEWADMFVETIAIADSASGDIDAMLESVVIG